MVGKKLLHYEIVEKLGEGGMGEVYRARDTKLGRDVAIKVLPEDLSSDPERRLRFEHEARVIAALNHPNIVTIHSVDEVDGRHFITMELVKGRTLRESITPNGVSLGMFFSVAVPLVDAMCSAHAQGITHRDLKPANVMLNEEGRLKVLDFGLAKLLQEATDVKDAPTVGHVTGDGQVLGTVSYMSPEQVEGKPLDGRSDIFSLGIVFYEMLTGRRPFAGDSNASTISSILRDTPPPVTEIRQTLPRHLGRIIRRCLAKDPNRRYQSPLDLRNDLQELAEELDSGDILVGTGEATEASGEKSDSIRTDLQPSVSSDSIVLPGTRRMYRWVLGVIGIIVVTAIVWTVTKNRSSEQPVTSTVASRGDATLGVIGFENLSDPEDTENLDRVLMGLVTTGLAESGGLNVASTAKVLAARRRIGAGDRAFDASMAPDAARSAGADVMLLGQVIRDGERTILTAELVDVASGNALGSIKKQAATSSELFELAGGIAHDVRELMGVTSAADASSDIDLAVSITNSPEAYRRFAAGEVAVHQGNYDQAVDLFNHAIRIDSTFALAYLKLLLAHTWNGETEKGLVAARRGLQFVDRLPERWRVAYQANIDYYEGNVDEAHLKLTRLVETSPDIPDAYNLLGEIVTHYSKYVDARRARDYFERALEIDPTFEVVLFHLVEDYIELNDVEALTGVIERYRTLNPADRRVLAMEIALWYAQQKFDKAIARVDDLMREGDLAHWEALAECLRAVGDWERALELSQQAVDRREKGYNQAFAMANRGVAQIGLGRMAAALADLDRASTALKEGGVTRRWADSIVGNYRSLQSFVLYETGDIDGAIKAAMRGIEEDPRCTWRYRDVLRGQLAAGRIEQAERTFHELKSVMAGNHAPVDAFVALLSEAELEAARGNTDEAMNALRRAGTMPTGDRDPWAQWEIEGDVKSKLGDPAGAIASYRKFLESRDFLLSPYAGIAVYRIPVLYKLGRAEEESGQFTEARRHYEAYLERWGDADVQIPNVADCRQRLQALNRAN